tara:strand:- start:2594 stop:3655 length:1062 start_codon:yes stop_codon:yes gene_type:complete
MGLPVINQISLNPDVLGEGVILVSDTLEYRKSWHLVTFTKSEIVKTYDDAEFNIGVFQTILESPTVVTDLSPSFAFSSPDAEARTTFESIIVSETIDYTYDDTTNAASKFEELIVHDLPRWVHHIPSNYDFPYRLQYVILKDEIKHKTHRGSHTENNNWPVESLLEKLLIDDIIRVEFITKTQSVIGEILFIVDDIDFIHMPALKNIVYHIDYDNFTKFIKLNPKIAHNLSYGSELVNKIILVDQNNKIKQYPGEDYIEESYLETKSFYIEHGVLQQFLVDFEKDPEVIDRFSSLVKNANISLIKSADYANLTANKWKGITNSESRGYSLSFVMRNIKKIKHMIFRFKTRLRE